MKAQESIILVIFSMLANYPSPRTYGKPQQSLKPLVASHTTTLDGFILGRSQEQETNDEDLARWIYKDPSNTARQ